MEPIQEGRFHYSPPMTHFSSILDYKGKLRVKKTKCLALRLGAKTENGRPKIELHGPLLFRKSICTEFWLYRELLQKGYRWHLTATKKNTTRNLTQISNYYLLYTTHSITKITYKIKKQTTPHHTDLALTIPIESGLLKLLH